VKEKLINWISNLAPYSVMRQFLPKDFILYGHVVSDSRHPVGQYYQFPTLARFNDLLDEFVSLGYRFVDLPTYLTDSCEKKILLTFDDGFKIIFDDLHPYMQKRKIPYAIFALTAPLDNEDFRIKGINAPSEERLFMDSNELKLLKQDGVHIGFHTQTHIRVVDQEPETIRKEFLIPAEHQNLFSKPIAFAYPYMAPANYERYNRFISTTCGATLFFDTKGFVSKDQNHFFRVSIDGELSIRRKDWLRVVIKRQLVLYMMKKIQRLWN
jgi:peptidoglycan/xylan/chitin deacetylase (PgdA/CDA1 family)